MPGVRHRDVRTSLMRFHVAEAGSGPPVLLLHAWPQHWWAWRRVIPLLAPDHRVLCPDLRGAGWSEAPTTGYRTTELVDDVLALLDELGIRRAVVVGLDTGGRLGFQLALRAPDRVAGLVTLNAMHPYWRARSLLRQAWRFWWTPLVETSLLGRWTLRRLPGVTRMVFRLGGARGVLSADEVEEYVAATRESAYARAGERLMHEFAYREIVPHLLGRDRPGRLTVPTLMLHGTRDIVRTARSLDGHQRHASDLRVEVIDGAGHWLPEECPEQVAEAVRQISRRARAGDDAPPAGRLP